MNKKLIATVLVIVLTLSIFATTPQARTFYVKIFETMVFGHDPTVNGVVHILYGLPNPNPTFQQTTTCNISPYWFLLSGSNAGSENLKWFAYELALIPWYGFCVLWAFTDGSYSITGDHGVNFQGDIYPWNLWGSFAFNLDPKYLGDLSVSVSFDYKIVICCEG